MGKGVIIANQGKGKFTVDVQHQVKLPERMITYYQDLIQQMEDETIPAAQSALNSALSDLLNAEAAAEGKATTWQVNQTTVLNLTQDIFDIKLALSATPPPGPDERALLESDLESKEAQLKIAEAELKASYDALVEAIRAVATAQYAYNDAKRAYDDALLDLTEAEKAVGLWQERNNFPDTDHRDLWCVDLSDAVGKAGYPEIPEGTKVNLLDLDLIAGTQVIGSAFPDGLSNNYDLAYGINQPVKASSEYGWMYNLMVYPGVVTWRNLWGPAIISNIDIDNDTCTIQRLVTSSAAGVNPLQIGGWDTETILTEVYDDIPVQYMECNAKAFEDGDKVVVQFDLAGQPEKVIGFVEKPKPCPAPMAVQFFDHVANDYPILTYDPDTGLWTKSSGNDRMAGVLQFRRGADLISAGTVSNDSASDTEVFWNGVSKGDPHNGSADWHNRCAWIDEDDRLIAVSYFSGLMWTGSEWVNGYGWDVQTKSGAGSWTTIHAVGPTESSADLGYAITGGWWVADDGKSCRCAATNGQVALLTISPSSVSVSTTNELPAPATVDEYDTYCINNEITGQRNDWEFYGARSYTGHVQNLYMSAAIGSDNSYGFHWASWDQKAEYFCCSRSPVYSFSPDQTWEIQNRHDHHASGGYDTLNGLTFNYGFEQGLMEKGGADWPAEDYNTFTDDVPYWNLTHKAIVNGLVSESMLYFSGYINASNALDYEVSIWLGGLQIEKIIDHASSQKITADSDEGCGGTYSGQCEPPVGFTQPTYYLPQISFSSGSVFTVHPTGTWAALFLVGDYVNNDPAKYGVYLFGRGKSNDLLPEYADCKLIGQIYGYDPDA